MSYEKELPRRMPWVYFNRLPTNLSDTALHKFFAERNLNIPLDHISVRNFQGGYSCAKVAIPQDLVRDLLNWAIDRNAIQGATVVAALPSDRHA
jgi:hypothetical protein